MNLGKILVIMEVSQKQSYIFASKRLRDNATRSAEINYVTSHAFFAESARSEYNEKENFVYSGGGHAVLQFESGAQADLFVRTVTEKALRQFPGLELFAKQIIYNNDLSAEKNQKNLIEALEKKKSERKNSFRQLSFGIERLDTETYKPINLISDDNKTEISPVNTFGRWVYPTDFEKLSVPIGEGKRTARDDNFIAVVHIDGNAMGSRSKSILDGSRDWDECCVRLRCFSECIQRDFDEVFNETVQSVISHLGAELKDNILPIRPVIIAGDDVCFVTAGCLGLECARIFLQRLAARQNAEDCKPYAACAGVAIVHRKYPFHRAYKLSEELCANAKKYGAQLDLGSRISLVDWHMEFGQLKDSLSELRDEYITGDGNRLELRPLSVVTPDGCVFNPLRSYEFFKSLCSSLKSEYGKVARGKIKELRAALKYGEVESELFIKDNQINDLLLHVFSAEKGDDSLREAVGLYNKGERIPREFFKTIDGVKRCLLFDSIEIIDHCEFFEEADR